MGGAWYSTDMLRPRHAEAAPTTRGQIRRALRGRPLVRVAALVAGAALLATLALVPLNAFPLAGDASSGVRDPLTPSAPAALPAPSAAPAAAPGARVSDPSSKRGTSHATANGTAPAAAAAPAAATARATAPAAAVAAAQPASTDTLASGGDDPTVQATDGTPAAAAAAPTITATSGAHLTASVSSALTARLAQLRSSYGIPGIEATIIFPDGTSWRAHAGFRNYGARVPVANSTPFAIASVSKTFLAALVIQLSNEGRFGLDDRLLTYLPTANVKSAVTIRELLDHTSGVYDFFSNSKIDKAILGCRTCIWTPAKSLAYLKTSYFAPGTGWAYSNSNYVLLGQLVEKLTGTSYATLLKQRFFDPLGLISTYVQVKQPAPYTVANSYRFYTSSNKEKPTPLYDGTGISPFRSLTTAAGAAGAIASSARDLAIWARALYSGQVLGTGGLTQMLDFATAMPYRSAVPYGLGVQQYSVEGRIAYGHGGRLMGARSAIRYLPTEGVSIAVVINTDRGDPAVIANSLLKIALPPSRRRCRPRPRRRSRRRCPPRPRRRRRRRRRCRPQRRCQPTPTPTRTDPPIVVLSVEQPGLSAR